MSFFNYLLHFWLLASNAKNQMGNTISFCTFNFIWTIWAKTQIQFETIFVTFLPKFLANKNASSTNGNTCKCSNKLPKIIWLWIEENKPSTPAKWWKTLITNKKFLNPENLLAVYFDQPLRVFPVFPFLFYLK